MRRWISWLRPSSLPLLMSRALRSRVEAGSMEYSAVSQPPWTFCSFIQRGTFSSMETVQMTWVLPKQQRTLPMAAGAMWGMKRMGRSWSGSLPSDRLMGRMGAGG